MIAPRKLFTRIDSLRIMTRKNPQPSPASLWRARFLEIARQVEGVPSPGRPSGLKPRSKMAGFAAIRLGRRAPVVPRLA